MTRTITIDETRVVPVEATDEMAVAAQKWQRTEYEYNTYDHPRVFYGGIYRAMLAAAPTPPKIKAQDGDVRDAARYRRLRNDPTHYVFVTRVVGGATIPRYKGEALDDLVDAMGAQAQGVEGV